VEALFATAEASFLLRNIASEESPFFNCLHALSEGTLVLVADLVEAVPLPSNSYTELLRCLFAAQQLLDIQLVEQPDQLPPGATQKLSELLAEIPRLDPRRPRTTPEAQTNPLFNCLFLTNSAWAF
jgi:hypothetical protein